jgi:hypothetical protein
MVKLRTDDCTFCYGNEQANHHLRTRFLYTEESSQQLTGYSLLSDTMPHIIPRGQWCDVAIQNVHATNENKCDDRENFYEELQYCDILGFSLVT